MPKSPLGSSPLPDTSPLWRRVGLVAGPLALAAIAWLPGPLHEVSGFGDRPAYAAAVAAMMAIFWLTEALPIAATACLPLVLYPAFGVFGRGVPGDAVRAAEPFLDAYIFLFLGGMTIGAAMEQWSLHRRIALTVMRTVGTRPKQLLFGMLAATALVSMWISNTATAVMMMPIGVALISQLELRHGRRLPSFGSAVMLAVAYGSNVGGIGTKIGTGTNSIFCGYVAEKLHVDIGFVQYMALGAPFVMFFIPVVWLVLWTVARRDPLGEDDAREAIEGELAAMGPMTRGERTVAIAFVVAATLWIAGDPVRRAITPLLPTLWPGWKFQGKHYEAVVAMSAAVALVLSRTVSFASLRRLPWGTLVLLGGSFAMAAGIEASGLSTWMAGELGLVRSLRLFAQVALTTLGTVFLTAIASNTATINVALNVLPRTMSVLVAANIAASCDFMLPAGTPPNAIVFGSGYVRLPTMMKTGFALDVAAVIASATYAYFVTPLVFG